MLTRRETLALMAGGPALGGALALPTARERDDNYLLLDQAEVDAVLAKAKRCEWAAESLKQQITRAEEFLAKPLDIPDRGGQWGHWYTCKKDGVGLVADSPTRHRCPKCGAIYTGEPFDSVYLSHIHGANSAGARDCGLAFRFTGRPEFAKRAADVLLGYAKRYADYPRHDPYNKDSVNAARVQSQVLDESTWIIPMAWGYTLVRSTLAEEDRQRIRRELLMAAADVIVGRSYARLPNIQCWKDSALVSIGLAIGDEDLVAEALDHPVRGFRVLMSRFVLPGGLWYECSLGYHHYTLAGLWALLEATRHHGIDLYSNEHYRSLFDAPIALAFPDNSIPGFNDNAGPPLSRWMPFYELAYARWGREEHGRVLSLGKRDSLQALLYGVEKVPSGSPVPKTSVLLREAGYGMLRSETVSVAPRFGMHGSGHGHPDKLNILTYGAGKMFGVDPGSIGYGVPLFFEWHKGTLSHNTVSVDQKLQDDVDAKVVDWRSTAGETALESVAEPYKGVTFRRRIVLRGNVLADRFQCDSASEHTYDWAFHAQGVFKTSLDLKPRKEPLGPENGYQHVHSVLEGAADGDWTARWEQPGAAMTLRIKGAPGTQVFTGTGPGPVAGEDVPLVIIRRKGAGAVFEVTHTFEKL